MSEILRITHTAPTIWFGDSLTALSDADDGETTPVSLRIATNPHVDEAVLRREFGWRGRRDGTVGYVEKLAVRGRYCELTFDKSVIQNQRNWQGIVISEEVDAWGTDEHGPRGVQTLRIAGLAWLLDKVWVRKSLVEQGAADPIYIGHGRAFNDDDTRADRNQELGSRREFAERGNRSVSVVELWPDQPLYSELVYAFSNNIRGENNWTAWEAANYLLAAFPPLTIDAATQELRPLVKCVLMGDEETASWHHVRLDTHDRTVKQLLDDLFDRRRGLGYWVRLNRNAGPDFDQTWLEVHVFSLVDQDLTLPSGAVLKANPRQRSLDFESAIDVTAELRNTDEQQYTRVIAQGARQTATATFEFGATSSDSLTRDWTDADETSYAAAGSGDAGYSALDDDEKFIRNAKHRCRDQLRHVFARFQLNPNFNGQLQNTGEFLDIFEEPHWWRGCRFLPRLPLREQYDYSGTKIADETFDAAYSGLGEPPLLAPFVALLLSEPGNPYELADQVSSTAADEQAGRRWACHLHVEDDCPEFELHVSQSGCQHFLSRTAFLAGSPAAYDELRDPDAHSGVDWTDSLATLTLELDNRIEVAAEIQAPAEGFPHRTLYIDVPDARYDYVVPGTVVRLTEGGGVVDSDGGALRDDFGLLEDTARAAAEWYGRPRQALTFSVRQIDTALIVGEFGDPLQLGDLITDVGGHYELRPTEAAQPVNSVITAIEFDLLACRTTFKTAYADLDFSAR